MGRNAQRRREGQDWVNRVKAQAEAGKSGIIQAPGNVPQGPFCPMLSTFLATGVNRIEVPGGGAANAMNMELVRVPCALGKDCMLWDAEWKCCGLFSQLQMMAELYGEDDDGDQVPSGGDAVPDGDPPAGG